ncbi:hypothetical protein ABZT49_09885 [Methylobacterium sp. EM32]|uniref:hypothetical protein n=1 Tax=Methylobacterium sp. EM32 TaxID=3163481 RepID=UPI0033AF55BB
MQMLLAATFAMTFPALAQAETWQPVSKTAVSITGKVIFTSKKINFQNGQSLAIKAATGEGMDGQIFKILKPADPILLRGSTLCGRSSVKYILVVKGDGPERGLDVFDGAEIPHQDTSPCATYSYRVGR